MDIKKFTATLRGDFAGSAMAVIAEYCITRKKTDALKKFQEFSTELLQTFTEEERKELQELVERMMERRATKMADTLGKTVPQEQIDQFVSDEGQTTT